MENINYDEVWERVKPYIRHSKNMDLENVKSKLEFYHKELNLNQDDLTKFFLRYPQTIVFDTVSDAPTSAKSKLKVFDMLGVDRENIVEHPFLLIYPAMRLRFRYMLTSEFFGDEQIFNTQVLATNEAAIYARYQYFKENFKKVEDHSKNLIATEKKFEKVYNIKTEDLIKKYPITEDVIKKVEEDYNARSKKDKIHKQISLTELEKEAVLRG